MITDEPIRLTRLPNGPDVPPSIRRFLLAAWDCSQVNDPRVLVGSSTADGRGRLQALTNWHVLTTDFFHTTIVDNPRDFGRGGRHAVGCTRWGASHCSPQHRRVSRYAGHGPGEILAGASKLLPRRERALSADTLSRRGTDLRAGGNGNCHPDRILSNAGASRETI